MSNNTKPVFIIGTGRCGTRSMFKMLSGVEGVEIHHEFACNHVQKLACLYYMGFVSKEEAVQSLKELHGSGVFYSDAAIWIDSSNKLSWLIPPLLEVFPDARFIFVVRDGRKVTSSFYNKLSAEMYDDVSTDILVNWCNDPHKFPVPPPEKKFWWNIPQEGQSWAEGFKGFDRFQRCCYHWANCNEVILESLRGLDETQSLLVKLEEVTSDDSVLKKMLNFLSLPYDPYYFEQLQSPQNVFFPMDFQLTEQQQKQFDDICSPMMKELNYTEKKAYDVKY